MGYCCLHYKSKDEFAHSYLCGLVSDGSLSVDVADALTAWRTFTKPQSASKSTRPKFSFMYEQEEYVRVRDVAALLAKKEISYYKSGAGGWRKNRITFNYKTNARATTFHGHFSARNPHSANGVQCVLRTIAEGYLASKGLKGGGMFVLKQLPLLQGNELRF